MDFKFGVELEAGFQGTYEIRRKLSDAIKEEEWNAGSDSSVICYVTGNQVIELKSKVYNDTDRYLKALKKFKPLLNEANETMGYHVHVSFPNIMDYVSICSRDFINDFRKKFIEFADKKYPFLNKRLANKYCSFEYPENYFKHGILGERRKAINFSAFNKHKTVEFRIFAMRLDTKYLVNCIGFLNEVIYKRLKSAPEVHIKDSCSLDSELTAEDLKFLETLKMIVRNEVCETPGMIDYASMPNYAAMQQQQYVVMAPQYVAWGNDTTAGWSSATGSTVAVNGPSQTLVPPELSQRAMRILEGGEQY